MGFIAPLLSPPCLLFDAAQGARWYIAIRVLHCYQAALSLRAVLVTNNTREFSRVEGLQLDNWALEAP
ncbi:MAG: hypothetical protein ABIO73_13625 [Polaromonas sp.]